MTPVFAPSMYSVSEGEDLNLILADSPKARNNPAGVFLLSLLGPIAMGVSYAHNRSIPWALFHGFIAPAYLVYRGVEYASEVK